MRFQKRSPLLVRKSRLAAQTIPTAKTQKNKKIDTFLTTTSKKKSKKIRNLSVPFGEENALFDGSEEEKVFRKG
jgi:hypothetical protein